MKHILLTLTVLLCTIIARGQVDVALYEQFNGRYDFTFIGNTLNTTFNGTGEPCTILTSSSGNLNLPAGTEIEAAYLYWAGSGTGDFTIKLNDTDITAERTFPATVIQDVARNYFSAFADVTALVQAEGNGTYTVSDFDLTGIINPGATLFCQNATNFGGWSILIVFKNNTLALNQVNVYDGLQFVFNGVDINFTLDFLNVIDNDDARIGFLAWEGDANIAVDERLRINGITMSNFLNPATNAFNSTNTITGSANLFNMDLDIYDMEAVIAPGDESAEVQLESGQDFVMVNAIATKINSILPDATVTAEIEQECDSREIVVNYTIHNDDATLELPANMPVSVYVNGDLVQTFFTTGIIPIDGSESGTITVTIPNSAPLDFDIILIADDDGTGEGDVVEIDEDNNEFIIEGSIWVSPEPDPEDLEACNLGDGTGTFDLDAYAEELKNEPADIITFYLTEQDALDDDNEITTTDAYEALTDPQEIWMRLTDVNGCYGIASFNLDTVLCSDAIIALSNLEQACNSRTITVTYTVTNIGDIPLLEGTQIAIYANTTLLNVTETEDELAVGASESGTVTLTIPIGIPLNFNLIFRVDDDGTGEGVVPEKIETNNTATLPVSLWVSPDLEDPEDLTECMTFNNSGVGIFDLSVYEESLKNNPTDTVTFYTSAETAENGIGFITGTDSYESAANPQAIWVRLEDEHGCYSIASFDLIAIDCFFPDGIITAGPITQECDSRTIQVPYTVGNPNSQDILPAATPIAIYIGTDLLATTQTMADIAINGTENGTITLTIPAGVPLDFEFIFVIDDDGTGIGLHAEEDEGNNTFTLPVSLWVSPVLEEPADMVECETSNNSGEGLFDFSGYEESLKNNPTDVVTFHLTAEDAQSGDNDIPNPESFTSAGLTQEIFVRLEDENGCFDTASFTLTAIDCYFPDAVVTIDDVYKQCNSRIIHVHYTVSNIGTEDLLPAGTPIAIYVNGELLDLAETLEDIPIGESESNFILLTIPVGIPLDFDLTFAVDDDGDGTGVIQESNEDNNIHTLPTSLVLSPELIQPEDIEVCDEGFGRGTFDFSHYAELLKNYDNETVTFYTSQPNADQDLDRIYNTTAYPLFGSPTRIYVRLDNGTCHTTASFLLHTKKCAPRPSNYVTPNGDGLNDNFFVEGLRNVFLNFKMSIYNRWGALIWSGDHNMQDWDGIASVSKIGSETTGVPAGTYYFVLELNDPDFPEPVVGWVYVTK